MSNSGLVQSRRDEALAFFQVNQAGRTAVERVVALFFSVAAIAGSVGVAARTPNVALPLPTLLLLLLSYMFQQYGDLTVIGTSRRYLEDLVNEAVGGKGLIYETAVAQIRQAPPLVRSMRLLQSLLGLTVLAATAGAAIVAIRDHNSLVLVSYVLATALAAASALYSFVHMHRSAEETSIKLAEQGLDDKRMIWIPGDLYRDARETAQSDELERQTFERLIRLGLAKSR